MHRPIIHLHAHIFRLAPVEVGQAMFHPLCVISLGEVFASVCTAAFLASFGAVHGRGGVDEKVL